VLDYNILVSRITNKYQVKRATTAKPRKSLSLSYLSVSDGDLNIDTGLDADVGDLAHNLGRGVDVEDSLVDAHLPSVEGVGTLTARRLADAESQELGGHADGAGDLDVLAESLVLELGANLLEGLNLSRGEGDANPVDGDLLGFGGLGGLDNGGGHFSRTRR
jgi:hypothetical protein